MMLLIGTLMAFATLGGTQNLRASLIPLSNIQVNKPEARLVPLTHIRVNKPAAQLFPLSNIKVNKPEPTLLSHIRLGPIGPEQRLEMIKVNKPEASLFPLNSIEVKSLLGPTLKHFAASKRSPQSRLPTPATPKRSLLSNTPSLLPPAPPVSNSPVPHPPSLIRGFSLPTRNRKPDAAFRHPVNRHSENIVSMKSHKSTKGLVPRRYSSLRHNSVPKIHHDFSQPLNHPLQNQKSPLLPPAPPVSNSPVPHPPSLIPGFSQPMRNRKPDAAYRHRVNRHSQDIVSLKSSKTTKGLVPRSYSPLRHNSVPKIHHDFSQPLNHPVPKTKLRPSLFPSTSFGKQHFQKKKTLFPVITKPSHKPVEKPPSLLPVSPHLRNILFSPAASPIYASSSSSKIAPKTSLLVRSRPILLQSPVPKRPSLFPGVSQASHNRVAKNPSLLQRVAQPSTMHHSPAASLVPGRSSSSKDVTHSPFSFSAKLLLLNSHTPRQFSLF